MEIKKIKLFSSAGNLLARRMRDKGDTAVGYVVGWRSGSGGGGWFGTMIFISSNVTHMTYESPDQPSAQGVAGASSRSPKTSTGVGFEPLDRCF